MSEVPQPPQSPRLKSTFPDAPTEVQQAATPAELPEPDIPETPVVESPPTRLKGSLLQPVEDRGAAETVPGIIEGARVVNRDSGKEFQVTGVISTKHGEKVNLIGPSGEKLTLGKDDLETKLNTDGAAWRL